MVLGITRRLYFDAPAEFPGVTNASGYFEFKSGSVIG
jgi:hypothetical protein